MTREEFLARLRETPAEWWYIDLWSPTPFLRGVRRGRVCHSVGGCPITMVAGHVGVDDYRSAARAIGLSDDLAEAVVAAADCRRGYDRELRRELLAACGLEKVRSAASASDVRAGHSGKTARSEVQR